MAAAPFSITALQGDTISSSNITCVGRGPGSERRGVPVTFF
jgi:hypothetical protein